MLNKIFLELGSRRKKGNELLEKAETLAHAFGKRFNLPEGYATISARLVRGLLKKQLMAQDSKKIFLKIYSARPALFEHLVLVSWCSMVLTNIHKQKNPNHSAYHSEKLIELVGIAGLYHDIALLQYPEGVDYTNKNTDIRPHAKLSERMVEALQFIPDEVRFMLSQHHDVFDVLKDSTFFGPTLILGVADQFIALVRPMSDEPMGFLEALNELCAKHGQLDISLFESLKVLVDKTNEIIPSTNLLTMTKRKSSIKKKSLVKKRSEQKAA